MKKKNLLGIILLGCLCLSLVGCGNTQNSNAIGKQSLGANSIGANSIEPKEDTKEDITTLEQNNDLYTVDSISKKLNKVITDSDKFEFDIDTYTCTEISGYETEYSDCSFYIFDDSVEAKNAFDFMKDNWFYTDDEDYVVTDTTIIGWESGVCDASIRASVYLTKNLIIVYNEKVIGSWLGDNYVEPTEQELAEQQAREELENQEIDRIRELLKQW